MDNTTWRRRRFWKRTKTLRPQRMPPTSWVCVYVVTEQWDKAETVLNEFLATRPRSAEGLYLLGYAFFRQGKYTESVSTLLQSLQHKPDNAEAHRILGLDYFQLNRWEAAQQELKTAVELNPQ